MNTGENNFRHFPPVASNAPVREWRKYFSIRHPPVGAWVTLANINTASCEHDEHSYDMTMARPSLTDWGLAEQLFHKGMSPLDICAVVNCTIAAFRQRKCRHKWEARRTQLTLLTSSIGKETPEAKAESPSVSVTGPGGDAVEWSSRMRGKLRNRVERLVEALPENAKALPGLNAAADIISKLERSPNGSIDPDWLSQRVVNISRLREPDADEPEPPHTLPQNPPAA